MSRVCVLVGEGKSEKSFLSSLLLYQLNFSETQPKGCIVYQSHIDQDLFWIFPVPSYGTSHKGGCRMLKQRETYIKCHQIVRGCGWLFGEYPEIHYRILTDTDNCGEKICNDKVTSIKEAFDNARVNYSSFEINFAHIEIESWFIAGLTESFPYLIKGSEKSYLLSCIPDKVSEPKKKLDDILHESIRGDRQRIARDFGEYMDLAKAKNVSPTFNNLITKLSDDKLLV